MASRWGATADDNPGSQASDPGHGASDDSRWPAEEAGGPQAQTIVNQQVVPSGTRETSALPGSRPVYEQADARSGQSFYGRASQTSGSEFAAERSALPAGPSGRESSDLARDYERAARDYGTETTIREEAAGSNVGRAMESRPAVDQQQPDDRFSPASPLSPGAAPSTGIRRSDTPWRPGSTRDYPGMPGARPAYQGSQLPAAASQQSVSLSPATSDTQLVLAVGDRYQFPGLWR
jgi:hypothetical protein